MFVEAARRVLASGVDATFSIAGPDQGEAEAVRRAISTSGFREKFRLLGDLPHDELMEVLAGSTALVLPSINEPYPMIVIEALAMGVPALVTTRTGLSETLDRSHAALLSEPDAEAVAQEMLRLARSPDLRNELSTAGRRLYESIWRPQSLAETLTQYYKEALAAG